MIQVADMIEEAALGFLPGDGGGRDLAATLVTLPAMFGSFRESLAALAAWMEGSALNRGSPHTAVAEMARNAAACAEAARAAGDRFRKENEFWLSDAEAGQMSSAVYGLTDIAGSGFIPDGSYPEGYQLADLLEALPELTDLIGEQLGILGEWIAGNMGETSGETSSLVTELAGTVSILSQTAEDASSIYQHQNPFWLDARK